MNESLERCASSDGFPSWIRRLEAKKRESLAGEERKREEKKMGLC